MKETWRAAVRTLPPPKPRLAKPYEDGTERGTQRVSDCGIDDGCRAHLATEALAAKALVAEATEVSEIL
jgi:hypothetical protein